MLVRNRLLIEELTLRSGEPVSCCKLKSTMDDPSGNWATVHVYITRLLARENFLHVYLVSLNYVVGHRAYCDLKIFRGDDMRETGLATILAATLSLSACGGVTAEKLSGIWECSGTDRPVYEFDRAGKYVLETLGDPNSQDISARQSMKISGNYVVENGVLKLTPSRILMAVEARDMPTLLLAANSPGRLRHIASTTFEITPGKDFQVMNAKVSGNELTLQVTKRIRANGQDVRAPDGGWKPIECKKK